MPPGQKAVSAPVSLHKNKNTKLYESAIEEMRVERKVADDDDDEEVFNLVFPSESGDG